MRVGRGGHPERRSMSGLFGAGERPGAVLVRHGQTEWSRNGRHTGRTDIPLDDHGRAQAAAVGELLAGEQFTAVLSSPLVRAFDTCALAGYGEVAEVDPDLMEWDYGAYEGRTSADIRDERGQWSLWTDGVPAGESVDDVSERAMRVVKRIEQSQGETLVFAHGHLLRVLAAVWCGLPPLEGRRLVLGAGNVSRLGWEHGLRCLTGWNLQTGPDPRSGNRPT